MGLARKGNPRQPAAPHSPLAIASGVLGVVAVVGGAIPPVRGLAGRWLQLLVPAASRPVGSTSIEPAYGALYLLPFVLVLTCSLLAIGLGVIAHLKLGLTRQITSQYDQQRRSYLATLGVLAGGVSLWLLLRL